MWAISPHYGGLWRTCSKNTHWVASLAERASPTAARGQPLEVIPAASRRHKTPPFGPIAGLCFLIKYSLHVAIWSLRSPCSSYAHCRVSGWSAGPGLSRPQPEDNGFCIGGGTVGKIKYLLRTDVVLFVVLPLPPAVEGWAGLGVGKLLTATW